MPEPLLAFEHVQIPITNGLPGTLTLDGSIATSDLAMIEVQEERHGACLAAAIFGRARPAAGRVLFLGRDWADLPPNYADALRGRIGWAPGEDGWLPHLSMAENICLPLLHHTRNAPDAVLEQATALAIRFGLPGLPVGPASEMDERDRARAAFVRAFLGSPSLIVLGRPRLVPPELIAPIANAIGDARERDAAVLWFVTTREPLNNGSIPASRRLNIRADGIVEDVS
jgi:phospholipid/cholesterol/gamma-HCH transport system ATP-binding protein